MRGVVASETRGAQTGRAQWPAGLCAPGVVRPDWGGGGTPRRVSNQQPSRTPLERATAGGESPVGGRVLARVGDREYGGAREIPSEAGTTTSQG
jgi:hypothetical protein